MNFKFNAPKFQFKPPNFGGNSTSDSFGVENQGISADAKFDDECHAVFRKFNNRQVDAREGRIKPLNAEFIKNHIPAQDGQMSYLLLNGNCSGIDLVMAIIAALTAKWGSPESLVMSSLSMNQDTIDKLATLPMEKKILLSSYFLATNENNIVGRSWRDGTLARAKIKIGIWRNHTKIVCINGPSYKIFIHGSANLRSAGDVNSMAVHFDSKLWEMNSNWISHLIEREPIEKFLTTKTTNANGFFTFLDQDQVKLFDNGKRTD